jgi:hypothetical protein
MRCLRLLLTGLAIAMFQHPSFAATNAWFAGSGLLPDQTTTNWVLGDTAAANPTLSGGHMLLSTAASSEIMYYRQIANLSIPANWTIEFRAKFDSRNAAINYNSGMSVFFTAAPYVGNILYFRQDDLWLANGLNVRGPGVALDTDSAFHTYRIELSGTSLGSAIKVFYDNGPLPVLTHQLVGDPNLVGSAARIGFGDGTAGDSGVSEWEYFWHNGSAVSIVPEPAPRTLLALGATLLATVRRKPNH